MYLGKFTEKGTFRLRDGESGATKYLEEQCSEPRELQGQRSGGNVLCVFRTRQQGGGVRCPDRRSERCEDSLGCRLWSVPGSANVAVSDCALFN